MSDIRKLVFFERGVETLTYFSHEMAASFRKMGYQIFFFDIQAEYADTKRLSRFLKSGETAVITFNFIGLSQERSPVGDRVSVCLCQQKYSGLLHSCGPSVVLS